MGTIRDRLNSIAKNERLFSLKVEVYKIKICSKKNRKV